MHSAYHTIPILVYDAFTIMIDEWWFNKVQQVTQQRELSSLLEMDVKSLDNG